MYLNKKVTKRCEKKANNNKSVYRDLQKKETQTKSLQKNNNIEGNSNTGSNTNSNAFCFPPKRTKKKQTTTQNWAHNFCCMVFGMFSKQMTPTHTPETDRCSMAGCKRRRFITNKWMYSYAECPYRQHQAASG